MRRLSEPETSPVLSAFFGDKQAMVIVPEKDEKRYRDAVKYFKAQGYRVKKESEVSFEEIKACSVLILSDQNSLYRQRFAGESLPDGGCVVKAYKSPLNSRRVVLVLTGKDADEINPVYPKLFRYGNYSLLFAIEATGGYNLVFNDGIEGGYATETVNVLNGANTNIGTAKEETFIEENDAWWNFGLGLSFLSESGTADPDGDGLTNNEEKQLGTDKANPDSDGDTLKDGAEVKTHSTNPLKADSDADVLKDNEEIMTHKTNPNKADTDGDGLNDYDEVMKHKTDPLKADSDGDKLNDGAEVNTHKTNPMKSDTDGVAGVVWLLYSVPIQQASRTLFDMRTSSI